jgi:hypothetical protein
MLAWDVPKNLAAGLMFVAFGAFGLWLARDLDAGTAADMGAGYFPRAVSFVLIAIGIALAIMDLTEREELVDGWAWKPFLLITASGVAFALLIKPLGLVATLAITAVLASAADRLMRPLAMVLLVAVLVIASVAIFVLALKMPIPLWPAVL